MELTSAEKNVLIGISFNTDDINRGELDENETALLMEMRAVADYLKEKYPSYNLEITGCDPKKGTVKSYDEWYFKAEGVERESAFIALYEDKEGELEIKDDFFGEIIRKEIEEYLTTLIKENNLPVIQINAGFWECLGKEYGEGIRIKEVLDGTVPAGNDIKIFLDGSALDGKTNEAVVSTIKECFKKEKFLGDIYIVILKDAESDFAKDRVYSKSITLE